MWKWGINHILAISAGLQELRTQGVASVVMAVWAAQAQPTSVTAQPSLTVAAATHDCYSRIRTCLDGNKVD